MHAPVISISFSSSAFGGEEKARRASLQTRFGRFISHKEVGFTNKGVTR